MCHDFKNYRMGKKNKKKQAKSLYFVALSETHSTNACYMKCEILSGISASMYSGNFHSSQRGKSINL